eukprot:4372913-Ditylum_brightwellii.AAC.1
MRLAGGNIIAGIGDVSSLGGKTVREDAVGETEVAESCPMLWVDEPAEGRGARSFGGFVGVEEVKGTKKGVGWVVEGYLLESGMVEGLNSTRS